MARKPRIQTPGLIRHVIARGNARMPIFLDDVDYRRFEYLLGEVVAEFDIQCWNYCVMPNHYHLTLCHTRPNLSASMRLLNGDYAQWWNRRHGRVGHAFQGPFKDQIVQRETYLLALCRYVAMNPVRAQLVTKPEQWPWSSYAVIAGLKPDLSFVDATLTHRLFGDDDSRVLQARFVEFVTRQPEDPGATDRIHSNEKILGDRAFKRRIKASDDMAADALRDGIIVAPPRVESSTDFAVER